MLWDSISGSEIAAVTLQTPDAVDDVVVTLSRETGARAFVSAKYRAGTIPLTKASPAFADTIEAFVTQFLSLSPQLRSSSRFVWAIPSSAGAAAAKHLPITLGAHRNEAVDSPMSHFVDGRALKERRGFEALCQVAEAAWKKNGKARLTERELREFLRAVYVELYDFGMGFRHERAAIADLRAHVVKPSQAGQTWQVLEQIFDRNNQSGLTATAASLRSELSAARVDLALPPDYTADIGRLKDLTERNLKLLNDHTSLPFGLGGTSRVHIDRVDELNGLVAVARSSDLLLTGEPGCGKSGLMHDAAVQLSRNTPVVLLLAEEMATSLAATGNLLGLEHPLLDVLKNWSTTDGGTLLTDALDSVREPRAQREIRSLLRDIRVADLKWRVVASVREFDLKHSRELRDVFPGGGAAGHDSPEFTGVSHFHLRGLTDDELDKLGDRRPEIVPFLESARTNPKSASLHKSPFYLRLAAELLATGVAPTRVADWNSPAILLRKFWENRVGGDGGEARFASLAAICRHMVSERTMVLATQEVSLDAELLKALNDLRSRGILQSPLLLHGDQIGGETIRFSHHLLHDYAIARAYIPTTADRFVTFVRGEALLPIFYRQSFIFALEEIWDTDQTRQSFWNTTFDLEATTNLHGLSRILGPMIAARRVERIDDLAPLLEALSASPDTADPAQKALRHLTSGLQDASAEFIVAGVAAWCEFVEKLSRLITSRPFLEAPVTHILARLDGIGATK